MKNFFVPVMSVLALTLAAGSAHAQSSSDRPLTLVVPFPAGSTTDNVARKMAEYMRAKTGGTVLVDNKAGADGNIAAQFVLRQPADGHTLFVTGNSVHGANANLYKQLPFDPIKDFESIGGVMTIPMVLTVKPDFPASNVSQFVAEAKKRTKPLFYATGNNSTRGASELFKLRYNFPADHIPYKGSPQVVADLLGGQFDFAFIDANTVRPFLQDGRLKGLTITSEKRLASLPNIPTVAEEMPGFSFGAWVGVVVRQDTPAAVRTRLASLVDGYAKDAATVEYMTSINGATMPMSTRELTSFIAAETKTWAEIVRAANIEKK
ncbi:Bug family tripartite tricarboxylate transporter substrate binding protein [Ottowia thiooxydans]|uniref:Bug family tripartite tricarboxylate transporter substrate binding protein n=1 Tax=Ottowia thiooxydans TaxID=219182 RepID=UPI00040B79BE|nr:tripartite tricarboxylate transporter substrate binding protein [Ottowia thiooxydans]